MPFPTAGAQRSWATGFGSSAAPEVDPGTEKARKELEERLEKRKAEKKETEERLEKQRAEKQEQEERQYNLKIDGKDVADLTGKLVELLGTSTSTGVTENGVSTFDVLA